MIDPGDFLGNICSFAESIVIDSKSIIEFLIFPMIEFLAVVSPAIGTDLELIVCC
jgi:hypothetical protein